MNGLSKAKHWFMTLNRKWDGMMMSSAVCILNTCSSLLTSVLITTVMEWKWMTKVLWVILRKKKVWRVEIRECLLMSAGLGCESRLVWLLVDAGRIFWSCVSYLWNSFERATKWFSGCNRCIRAKDSWVQTPTSMRSLHVNPALLDLWKFQSLKKNMLRQPSVSRSRAVW